MFDWIIVGGGIHGCTIATYLLKSGVAQVEDLLIIDPNERLLFNWQCNTDRIGMEYLRSPGVHHIDVKSFSLERFGKQLGDRKCFYGHYKRPSLDLFNEHCMNVIRETRLNQAFYQGKVVSLKRHGQSWNVHTNKGTYFSGKRVIVAISTSGEPVLPEWAKTIKGDASNHLHHIYDQTDLSLTNLNIPIVVVGGGISAVHTVIKLSSLYPGKVSLLKRHPFRVHDFDSDPGWLGPKNMNAFKKINDYNERRRMIQNARHRGSIPNELHLKIRKLVKERMLFIVDGEVNSLSTSHYKYNFLLHLNDGQQVMKANSLILATGFQSTLLEQSWLKQLIVDENLSCANCGFPIINENLEWCPHLYVTGPLAELEIGPVSRNISGARRAAERIVSTYTY
ncbi:NAD(P)-binding domain-containing protein [Bacillus sp. AK128]